MRTTSSFILTAAAMLIALPAGAQQGAPVPDTAATPTPVVKPTPAAAETTTAPKSLSWAAPIQLQHSRPNDQRGINVFETPKDDTVSYTGFKLSWGAAFTQQFQALDHSTRAASRVVG